MLVASHERHCVAGCHFSFPGHAEIKAGSPALQKPLHHVSAIEADAQLEAWHAWLGDRELRGTNPQPVPDANFVLDQTFRGEVLSKRTPWERKIRKLLAPVLIVLGGIDVHRFVHAPVHGEVGLLVTNNVQSIDAYPAG